MPELLQASGKDRRVSMNAPRNRRESLRTMPHGVHAGHHREQHLCRAHVGCGLLASDVLLAGLERHAKRRTSARITAHTDDPARQHPLEFILRGEEGGVRTAVAERNTEALGVADADVRAPLARWCEQHEAQQVSGDNGKCTRRVQPVARLAVVEDRAVGRGILDQNAERLVAEPRSARVTHFGGNPAGMRARLHDVDRLRVASRIDEKAMPRVRSSRLIRQKHRLGGGGPFVEQRRIRDLETGEIDDHCLEVQQRFEPALRDLGLIWRVRRVPAGILQHVSLHHGRGVGIVVAVAEKRTEDLVLARDVSHRGQRVVLASARVDGEGAREPDCRGNRRVDEGVQRVVAQVCQHCADFRLVGANMAGNERVGAGKRHGAERRGHASLRREGPRR